MSPENEKVNKHLSKFQHMTTRELEQLLQHDLDTPDPGLSAEEILDISQVLLRREPEAGPELTPQQSWQEFQAQQPRKVRRRFRRTMLIAAVLAGAMTFSLVAGAVGGRDIRTVVGAWDIYGFHFDSVLPYDPADPLTMGDINDPRWRELVQTDYAPGLTPTELPERFQMSRRIINDEEKELRYSARYTYGDKWLNVSVMNFRDSASRRLSVTGDPLETYCYDDVIYYIFACNERYVVVWFEDGYECDVVGDITLVEAREIIRSVVEGKENNDENK